MVIADLDELFRTPLAAGMRKLAMICIVSTGRILGAPMLRRSRIQITFFAMGHEELVMVVRVFGALLIGGLIGFERTFHGRPAGFRTHSLVCMASALLMLVTVYQSQWMTQTPLDAIRTDPTRMAQGIMTGIGFLGAGVIFKEGLTVRGLTTAASIWITAAIGILVGIGFYFAAVVGTLATLAVLAVFRWIEQMLPAEFYAHHMLRFDRENVIAEAEVRGLLHKHGFSVANLSSRLTEGGKQFEYRMVIRSKDRKNGETLAEHLRRLPEVLEFRISPTGD
jgi:putative Mg2+ transporter-C (MgtC) family protein